MGMFSTKSGADGAAAAKAQAAVNSLSVIGVGMVIRGDIETAGVVKVEGTVEGHVIAGTQVLVAKGGIVKGDVETREAIIGGEVAGAVAARDRVEIQAGAAVQGDITTKRIAVAEGASLNGQIRMGELAERAVVSRTKGAVPPPAPPPGVQRPSVPVARVAVSPRSTGSVNNH
jgi:cytoskeletal protein CcmA (bactofilin family)